MFLWLSALESCVRSSLILALSVFATKWSQKIYSDKHSSLCNTDIIFFSHCVVSIGIWYSAQLPSISWTQERHCVHMICFGVRGSEWALFALPLCSTLQFLSVTIQYSSLHTWPLSLLRYIPSSDLMRCTCLSAQLARAALSVFRPTPQLPVRIVGKPF